MGFLSLIAASNAILTLIDHSLGFWAVLTQASFSYGGMEGLASIVLEASNPRK